LGVLSSIFKVFKDFRG
jgi:hypothetical protein